MDCFLIHSRPLLYPFLKNHIKTHRQMMRKDYFDALYMFAFLISFLIVFAWSIFPDVWEAENDAKKIKRIWERLPWFYCICSYLSHSFCISIIYRYSENKKNTKDMGKQWADYSFFFSFFFVFSFCFDAGMHFPHFFFYFFPYSFYLEIVRRGIKRGMGKYCHLSYHFLHHLLLILFIIFFFIPFFKC